VVKCRIIFVPTLYAIMVNIWDDGPNNMGPLKGKI
jgi:hypothetical protein